MFVADGGWFDEHACGGVLGAREAQGGAAGGGSAEPGELAAREPPAPGEPGAGPDPYRSLAGGIRPGGPAEAPRRVEPRVGAARVLAHRPAVGASVEPAEQRAGPCPADDPGPPSHRDRASQAGHAAADCASARGVLADQSEYGRARAGRSVEGRLSRGPARPRDLRGGAAAYPSGPGRAEP